MTKLAAFFLLIGHMSFCALPHTAIAQENKEYLNESELIDIDHDHVETEVSVSEETLETPQNSDNEEKITNDDQYKAYTERVQSMFQAHEQYLRERYQALTNDLKENEDIQKDQTQKIQEIESTIRPLQQNIVDLKGQLKLLNAELYLSQKKIEHATREIQEKEKEIEQLMTQITHQGLAIKSHREKMKLYSKLLYKEQLTFLDTTTQSTSTLKLLLADNSFGQSHLQIAYMRSLSMKLENLIYDYELQKKEMIENQELLDKKRIKTSQLQDLLSEERKNLALKTESKSKLLAVTQGKEEIYQDLLKEAKLQKEAAEEEIQKLKENVEFFEKLLREAQIRGTQIASEEEKKGITQKRPNDDFYKALEKTYNNFFESDDDAPLRWPILPGRGISAYFMDPTYPFKGQIGNHKAIDLPANQSTPIHAPRAAVVGKVKKPVDGSYAYVILIHGNNIMTVYGHVSEVFVEEGDLLQEGDIFALTGGAIGTNGAGWATTGAHLHFEVYKDGEHVDPLGFLPLSELDERYVPLKYRDSN